MIAVDNSRHSLVQETIYSVEGRREAILEMVRVLKPGGQVDRPRAGTADVTSE